jgi:diaminopimelate epimerase
MPDLRFTKMHGAGNDYVYVDAFRDRLPNDIPALARVMSDRHRGIGGDGLIVIGPSDRGDARMRMFNADGSEAEMCGNGIRCVAKYVYDHGLARKERMDIETGRGVLTVDVQVEAGKARQVRVNMGRPILSAPQIPTTLPGNPPVRATLEVAGRSLQVTCVSMGNPHCITFVEAVTDDWVHVVGPQIERHPAFPRRVNCEFVRVISPREIEMRVWERGSGETLACGTGACASLVACVLNGLTERSILCHLPGGDLSLEWADSDEVFMTGPAVEVFSGTWRIADA